jgi:hypothetical protein
MSACSTSSVYIDDSYKAQKLEASRLLVTPVKPTISNPDDVLDDLGPGVADDVYFTFFANEFPKQLRRVGRIGEIVIHRDSLWIAFKDTLVEIDAGKFQRVSLPSEVNTISVDSIAPDFVLILDRFRISRFAGSSSRNMFSGRMEFEAEQLRHELQFVLWDNSRNSLVSYGSIEARNNVIMFKMTKNNWEKAVSQIAEEIIEASPFRTRR